MGTLQRLMPLFLAAATSGCSGPASPEPAISEDFLFSLETVQQRMVDIDHDGQEELFLGNPAMAGNAGMPHLVLQRRGEDWVPLGELFFNPYVFRVLPLGADGKPRMVIYSRISASEGTLLTMTYDRGAFRIVDAEHVRPGDGGTDEGRQRVHEVFGAMDGGPSYLREIPRIGSDADNASE